MTLKQYYEQAKKLKETAENIDLNAWSEGYECGYEDGKNDYKIEQNKEMEELIQAFEELKKKHDGKNDQKTEQIKQKEKQYKYWIAVPFTSTPKERVREIANKMPQCTVILKIPRGDNLEQYTKGVNK